MSLVDDKPRQIDLLTVKQLADRVAKSAKLADTEIKVILPSQLLDGMQVIVADKNAEKQRVYATARLKFINEAVFEDKTDVMCVKVFFTDVTML